MRIDGKRASAYTNEQLVLMLNSGASWNSLQILTNGQKHEIKKVLDIRSKK